MICYRTHSLITFIYIYLILLVKYDFLSRIAVPVKLSSRDDRCVRYKVSILAIYGDVIIICFGLVIKEAFL